MTLISYKRFLSTALVTYQVFFLSGLDLFAQSPELKVGQGPRVAIIDVGGKVSDENTRANIVSSIRQNFNAVSYAKQVPKNTVLSYVRERQTNRKEKLESLKKAYKLLRDGKEAYNAMRLDEALERLNLAKREFVSNLNELDDNQALLESYLYLGMTYIAKGSESEAYLEFKKVLFLDNKKLLSPKAYSPKVVEIFERAKQDIDSLPRGTVLIDSTPSNSTVYVNAKKIGITPVNTLLPVGEYFLKVVKEGYLDWYQLISVEDKVNDIEMELPPLASDEGLFMALRPVSEMSSMEPSSQGILLDAARRLNAQIVVLAWIERDARDIIFLQFFDARTRKVSYVSSASLGKNFSNIDNGINKAVTELNSSIDEKGYVIAMEEVKAQDVPTLAEKGPTPEQIAARKKQKWTRKWWVWTIIGAVAAGAGVGVYYGVAGSGGGITVINKGNF